MKKAFISYSWKDEAVALRLYRDLKRQNICIWLDRIDGEPTGDFKEEFLRLINGCDFFIVIDSENYRHKSHWCETELRAYFNRVDNQQNVSMIVCLAERPGEWRAIESVQDISKQSLYERLNAQKYYILSHEGIYDNEKAYFVALESIQHILGKDSYSWDMFPEEADLIDELASELKTHPELCDNDRESLMCSVRSIVLRRNQNKDITKHLQLLIGDCDEMGLSLFIPRWMYSIWLADNRHGENYYKECFDTLKSLSIRFPKEPRVYRALGGIAARLKQQQLAADYYKTALGLIDMSQKNIRYEVFCNLGQVYMNLKHYFQAKEAMKEALRIIEEDVDAFNSTLVVNYFECLIHLDKTTEAGAFIIPMANKHLSSSEIQCACGYYYLDCGQVSNALVCFQRAYSLNPSMENAYGYLRSLYTIRDMGKYKTILSEALSKSPTTKDDKEWRTEILKLPQW